MILYIEQFRLSKGQESLGGLVPRRIRARQRQSPPQGLEKIFPRVGAIPMEPFRIANLFSEHTSLLSNYWAVSFRDLLAVPKIATSPWIYIKVARIFRWVQCGFIPKRIYTVTTILYHIYTTIIKVYACDHTLMFIQKITGTALSTELCSFLT